MARIAKQKEEKKKLDELRAKAAGKGPLSTRRCTPTILKPHASRLLTGSSTCMREDYGVAASGGIKKSGK